MLAEFLLTLLLHHLDSGALRQSTPPSAAAAANVAAELCVLLCRTDVLFGAAFDRFRAAGALGPFVTALEPLIVRGLLPAPDPEIVQVLVEHYAAAGAPDIIQRAVLHMDIPSLDFNQVARLCRAHRLYAALIHIFNRGLGDFLTPACELLVEVAHGLHRDGFPSALSSQARAAAAPDGGVAPAPEQLLAEQSLAELPPQQDETDLCGGLSDDGLSDLDGQGPEEVAAAAPTASTAVESLPVDWKAVYGYRLLAYVHCCLRGEWFPPGGASARGACAISCYCWFATVVHKCTMILARCFLDGPFFWCVCVLFGATVVQCQSSSVSGAVSVTQHLPQAKARCPRSSSTACAAQWLGGCSSVTWTSSPSCCRSVCRGCCSPTTAWQPGPPLSSSCRAQRPHSSAC